MDLGTLELDEVINSLVKIRNKTKGKIVPVFIDGDKIYGISEITYDKDKNKVTLW